MTQERTCNYCGGGRIVAGFLQGARLSFQPMNRSLTDTAPGVGATVESSACLDCGAIHLACDAKELQLVSRK